MRTSGYFDFRFSTASLTFACMRFTENNGKFIRILVTSSTENGIATTRSANFRQKSDLVER